MSGHSWWPLEWYAIDTKGREQAVVCLRNGKCFIAFNNPMRIWRERNGQLVRNTCVRVDSEFELKAFLIAEAQT